MNHSFDQYRVSALMINARAEHLQKHNTAMDISSDARNDWKLRLGR